MKLVFNPTSGSLDWVSSTPSDVGLAGLATNITAGKTLTLTAADNYTITFPASGTVPLLGTEQTFTAINRFTLGTTSSNVFIGGAGRAASTGVDNVGIGSNNSSALTSSSSNVAIGSFSLNKATTGDQNFALGYGTLFNLVGGRNNVAIGVNTLGALVSGVGCVSIGHSSLRNTTGSENTALGYLSGFSLTSGVRSIFLGAFSGYRQTTTSDLLIIDNQQRASAAVEAENSFLYGSMAAGGFLKLNIGTTTNNAPKDTLKLQAYVSTASTGAANGFGVGLPFFAETATDGTYQQQGLISTSWIDSTNATRKAKLSLSAYDTAARLGLEIEADGSVAKIGFFGGTTAIQQVLAAYTTDDESAAYAGIDNAQAGTVYATVADLNALRVAYETLRASYDDLRTKLQTSTLVG